MNTGITFGARAPKLRLKTLLGNHEWVRPLEAGQPEAPAGGDR
jgi:hypothetical protein